MGMMVAEKTLAELKRALRHDATVLETLASETKDEERQAKLRLAAKHVDEACAALGGSGLL